MPGIRNVRLLVILLAVTPVGALLVTGGILVSANVIRAVHFNGRAMYPTIHEGDRIILRNTRRAWKRGQLVAYVPPKDEHARYLHRIVGIGGDEVLIEKGVVFLNGKMVERKVSPEPCTEAGRKCSIWIETLDGSSYKVALSPGLALPDFGPVTVPDGHVYLLGDNRDNSMDSRYIGTVPVEHVLGTPVFVYWPSDDMGRIGEVIR